MRMLREKEKEKEKEKESILEDSKRICKTKYCK